MNRLDRQSRAESVLAGYDSGPGATRRARDVALGRAEEARMVVLVEGISDLMALDAVAQRRKRDLSREGIAIVPVGGANAFEQHVARFSDAGVEVRGLVDEGEVEIVRAAITSVGIAKGWPDMERPAVFVCVEDLEDELIRAVTPPRVEAIFEREGDLGSFRSLQRQPAWREGGLTAQLRRFMGAGARRKLRYARLLALELDFDQVPKPLDRVLTV
jgi:hypothetical protein